MSSTLVAPEIFCLLSGLFFLCLALARRPRHLQAAALLLSGLGVVISLAALPLEGTLWQGAYKVDLFSQVFKVLLFIGLFLVLCACSDLGGIPERLHPEFYFLLFFCTLATLLLASSAHLLSIYVSLELSSYSLYILVALRKDRAAGVESALKYFLIGVFSSAVMLFGMAILYGTAQTATLSDLARTLPGLFDRPVIIFGILLTLCGFFFKLALFPFHFWAPDAYEGAPNQVTAYIATVSKIAGVAVLVRVVASTPPEILFIGKGMAALAIVSMTAGNLAAIVQKDVKRLLAYSSVSHAGYVLIGILSMSETGYSASVFYALTILLMKFTCFMVVIAVAAGGGNINISGLAGLHRRSPILALALLVSLFALAGIPPTIGFTGKFLVFAAAMHSGYFTLVLIAMINVAISLYYYLLILKAAYLDEPETEPPELTTALPARILAILLVAVTVWAGIFPAPLIRIADAAAKSLFR